VIRPKSGLGCPLCIVGTIEVPVALHLLRAVLLAERVVGIKQPWMLIVMPQPCHQLDVSPFGTAPFACFSCLASVMYCPEFHSAVTRTTFCAYAIVSYSDYSMVCSSFIGSPNSAVLALLLLNCDLCACYC
jgi:hypothetical protein